MSDAQTPIAGAEISLRIGQRVSHDEFKGRRVTGIVRGLDISDEQVLTATVLLDEPIILPDRTESDREIRINWQTIPAHELAPFDARDELIATLSAALQAMLAYHDELGAKPADQALLDAGYAAVAQATGSVA